MKMLPKDLLSLMLPFAALVSNRVWQRVMILVVGAILAPGKRTVSAILRVMGFEQDRHFQNYHRVLNRAKWSSRKASAILLKQLVRVLAPTRVLVMGLDETIERRWGKHIAARGIYRDPVRSSHEHTVKASGLRWISLMLLVPIPWAQRVWALPFLTVLAPSERYHQTRNQRHKTLTEWARQMLKQVRRWLPMQEVVVVADSTYAALDFLASVSQWPFPVHVVTRLRLDAALYAPAPPRQPKQMGRPRLKGKRLPTLATVLNDPQTQWQLVILPHWYGGRPRVLEIASQTAVWYHSGLPPVPIRWVLVRDPLGQLDAQAFLCTNLDAAPIQIVSWFCQRWQLEVTFEEVRAHLGVETQRQWSDLAIVRTTPALLGLFSLVVLFAHQISSQQSWQLQQSAWYSKSRPTFSDALALVRAHLWAFRLFQTSDADTTWIKVPAEIFDTWLEQLCYAA
jgi:hypothetical protein